MTQPHIEPWSKAISTKVYERQPKKIQESMRQFVAEDIPWITGDGPHPVYDVLPHDGRPVHIIEKFNAMTAEEKTAWSEWLRSHKDGGA